MIEYIKTFLKIALYLTVWYGVLVFITNQPNLWEWGTATKIIFTIITMSVIRVNLDKH